MSEIELAEAELPLDTAGTRLQRAREAAGMDRAQLAAVTRIPERHLAAIEAGDFSSLPARAYAVGFSRSYAKAVNLDPEEIVSAVRTELAEQEPMEPRRTIQTFEPGDPARIPGVNLVWLAAAGIIAVLLAVFLFARPMIAPGMSLPSILPEETPAAAPAQVAAAPVAPAPAGPVVFTALEQRVWVKFTDAAGNQLFQKELAQGETWTVPADQADVRIATARPDALSITIGGQPVAKLAETQGSIRDVPVTAAALLARGATQPEPAATPVAAQPAQQRSASAVRQAAPRPRASSAAASPTPSPTIPPVDTAPASQAPVAAAT